jgi:hypothetical protein
MTHILQTILLHRERWPSKFLSRDLRIARIDLSKGRAILVPFRRLQRWLNPRAQLDIGRLIAPGKQIKFDPILSKDRSFGGLIEVDRMLRLPAKRDSLFYALIGFPFGEFLRISELNAFDFIVESAADGNRWQVSHIALTHLTEIEISA